VHNAVIAIIGKVIKEIPDYNFDLPLLQIEFASIEFDRNGNSEK
jgi:hypothetical protein